METATSVGARGLVFAITFFAGLAPLCSAQTPRAQAAADVAVLLRKHDEAMNQHDIAGVMQLYAAGPKTVLLGTGPGERYQGLAEIRTAYTEFFKDFDKGTLDTSCYWKDGGGAGTVAWGAAMCKITDSLGGKKREYELNVSAVLEKQGSRWLFRLLHFSNLTGAAANQ
jgi:ketosteroid isomerase-like protein